MNNGEDECRKVGGRIRAMREGQDLSQEKLAKMIGMDPTYLSRVEQGKRNPTVKLLAKIAHGLGVELKELFDFSL
ncbi:helix-turn-helix domain-containing protein [Gordonibacter massiliensis (ex Traore et al. 2017)]|uniref:Helix-turn-helix transcriptional regulator n=1 Tax=Gordonibacter massiliensis (ex Traore et al. 2017) TaxID=1841863 RepID=A0A842JBR9_9ACTN|nr:helix-turn-helix transcriptional regulator [Gordonibacter massiliensis (ex Traore et al. 2017)]MBC2888286.1 helix-turn-helix transcriptional regulator [Gordonibacter massiliensis (ex Traore et al. 2017)]MBX9032924.1 helix-turn-helix transcriptional regulator [Gordonibacter massiliensis (ex Traore et al. 2017)]